MPDGRFGAKGRRHRRRSGSLTPVKVDGTPRHDLGRPANSPDDLRLHGAVSARVNALKAAPAAVIPNGVAWNVLSYWPAEAD